ncbi:MAG: hypothetical protein NT003_04000 [Candidatus Magasanikbacteria bacterium]|nr:hypothetical protein [Candidatus Magasanikbacteria bacterium]
MLEHLFGSRTRVKLLRIFFRDSDKYFYVRELTRLLDVQINAVRRELINLSKAGIIATISEESVAIVAAASDDPHEAKRKYYQLNQSSVLYPELRALLMKSHMLGEQSLVEEFKNADDVRLLIFTGIFTNAKETPIDMLVVGDISERRVAKIIADFEHEHGAQVRYTVLSVREYSERKQLMDRFLYAVLDAPHAVAIDTLKRDRV